MAKKQVVSDNFESLSKEMFIVVRKTSKYEDDFELLKSDPIFKKDIRDVRSKLDINIENPVLPLLDDSGLISGLLKKYRLPENWENILTIYILTNEFERMFDPQGTRVSFDYKKKTALIEVGIHTTLADVKNAYKVIMKNLKSGTTPRKTVASKSDRDTFIYELNGEGKKYKKISEIIYEKYGKKILEADLSRIVDKMKKRRKKI